MRKIIIDTNFLMIPSEFGVDIFSELENMGKNELYVLEETLDELKNIIGTQGGNPGKAAKLGLELIKHKKVNIIPSENITEKHKNVDAIIIGTAKKGDFTVATQDTALKAKLRQNNVPLIILRQKKYLKLV